MSRYVQPLAAAFLLGAAVMLFVWKPWEESQAAFDPDKPAKKDQFGETRGGGATVKQIAFDGDRAMTYLKQLCDIGPRVSATDGMTKQQEVLVKHFEALGGTVTKQEFEAKQESRRDKVKMTNLTVSWFPDRDRRVMLCTHYDTRPMAHEEANRNDWKRPFLSANDGTSGVAMFMELAHSMKDFPTGVGVDFVFFDGEEYIFEPTGLGGLQKDRFFIGSDHFAEQYAATKGKRKHKYEAAVLFDLFAHPGAKFAIEGYSWEKAEPLVRQFWQAAANANAGSFVSALGIEVSDDHLALNRVGIPAIDVIDFDGYRRHWHKLSDTPDKCDGKQMAEVARVATTWLQGLK